MHHRASERRQPMMPGCSRCRIGPVVVKRMGQRHVARAEHIHLAQHRQRIVDLMTTLEADQGGDAAGLECAHDVVRRIGHCISFG